jgi:hypothetical protein
MVNNMKAGIKGYAEILVKEPFDIVSPYGLEETIIKPHRRCPRRSKRV